MTDPSETAGISSLARGAEQGEGFAEGSPLSRAPLKVVTGTQTTGGLNFELQPGAIVAHEGASVIFVCG